MRATREEQKERRKEPHGTKQGEREREHKGKMMSLLHLELPKGPVVDAVRCWVEVKGKETGEKASEPESLFAVNG